MKILEIEGRSKLGGTIKVSGNKNAALPMITAALLTDDEIILHNVPHILDVVNMLRICEHIGLEYSFSGDTLRLKCHNLRSTSISAELCSPIRTSMLFAGPMLARFGRAEICRPGGDFIGRRRLDAHIYGLKCLGAEVS
ncbi:MAG: UDP-N-acetylglucosamine 1-carboxyvinyltransferase, partial [Candidatus Nanoarchaeia archaeon]